jgi:hypothetical protein
MMNGRVISASTNRSDTHSTTRPKTTDASPAGMPSSMPTPTASKAPNSERPVPSISRLNTSRPR